MYRVTIMCIVHLRLVRNVGDCCQHGRWCRKLSTPFLCCTACESFTKIVPVHNLLCRHCAPGGVPEQDFRVEGLGLRDIVRFKTFLCIIKQLSRAYRHIMHDSCCNANQSCWQSCNRVFAFFHVSAVLWGRFSGWQVLPPLKAESRTPMHGLVLGWPMGRPKRKLAAR